MRGRSLGRSRDFLPIDGEIEEEERQMIEDVFFQASKDYTIDNQSPPVVEIPPLTENDPLAKIRIIDAIEKRRNSSIYAPDKYRNSHFSNDRLSTSGYDLENGPPSASIIRRLSRQYNDDGDKRTSKVKIKKLSASIKEPDNLVTKIVSIFRRCKRPLSITEILDKLVKLELIEPGYHLYSRISKLIKTNYLLFKTKNGLIYLRKGCFKPSSKPAQITVTIPNEENRIVTLVEVIERLTKESSTSFGTYPGLLLKQLQDLGYKCSLNSIKIALRSPKFIKVGNWYKLANQD